MVRILKHGEERTTLIYGVCDKCECEVLFEPTDLNYADPQVDNESYICPDCNSWSYGIYKRFYDIPKRLVDDPDTHFEVNDQLALIVKGKEGSSHD